MTNAELIQKIRSEITKRLKNVRDYMNGSGMKYIGPKYHESRGKESAYDAILSFLSTLESEKPVPNDLEEAAKEYTDNKSWAKENYLTPYIRKAFLAGAKWQAEHTPLPEDTVLFNKGVEEGKRLMIEEAVEGVVEDVGVNYIDLIDFDAEKLGLIEGDKVRVIVCKNEDE